MTCLKDPSSGQYCADFIFNAFGNTTGDSDGTGLPSNVLCSPCVVNTLRQMQSTPYSNYGPQLATSWASIQSTCGISYPTAVQPLQTNVTNLPGYSMLNTTTQPSCLSGNTYTVVGGDNCGLIAQAHNVSTGGLIAINQLLPDCTDLQIGQVLCLPQSCATYVVQPNDSCYSIALANNLLYPEVIGWNPGINSCKPSTQLSEH